MPPLETQHVLLFAEHDQGGAGLFLLLPQPSSGETPRNVRLLLLELISPPSEPFRTYSASCCSGPRAYQ
jgi:hypothetical protein